LGKSTPTSITVVETKILNLLSKKLFNIFSFSTLSILPCKRPTFPGKILFKYSNFLIVDWWSIFFY